MGILSRLLRLFKADVHGVMDQLEDKGLMLKQCLREMEAGLEEKDARLTRMTLAHQEIEDELSRHREEVRKLETDLNLAVSQEKDDIARMLIRKRRTLQNGCEQLTYQINKITEEKNRLSEMIARQRLQYHQLKIKAAAFCQRREPCDFEKTMALAGTSCGWKAPTEEEIELELLQRKATQGGAS